MNINYVIFVNSLNYVISSSIPKIPGFCYNARGVLPNFKKLEISPMPTLKDKIEFETSEIRLFFKQKLSQFPRWFRWLLIIGVLLLIPTYLITKNVTLNIWQKKYSQYLITAKPSFQNPKPVKIIKTYLVSTAANTYAAATEIRNDNLDLALKNQTYTYNFYNDKNELVYSDQGTFFLLPNQETYIVMPRLETNEHIQRGELQLPEQPLWQKPLFIPQVRLLASLPYVYDQMSPQTLVAEGVVENTSAYQLRQIRIVFLIFDKTGKAVGISQRYESVILPNERRAYKQLWPNLSAFGLSVQVFAETNTLDVANITAPDFPANSSSDLNRPQTNPR